MLAVSQLADRRRLWVIFASWCKWPVKHQPWDRIEIVLVLYNNDGIEKL